MNDSSFGRWMKQQRRALDLTQAGLAELVGCTKGTIRYYEIERLRPSGQVAEHLAEHLQIPHEQRQAFLQAAREPLPSAPSHQSAGHDPEDAPLPRTPYRVSDTPDDVD
jgi:transcriptional regulator with XRE-family HTH domain